MKSSKSLKSLLDRDKKKSRKQSDADIEDHKLKKSKSSTSLSAIFSRPGSSKGIRDEELREQKGKENRTPPETPIWAQFATTQDHSEISKDIKVPLNDNPQIQNEIALYTPHHYSPRKQRIFPENERPTLSRRIPGKARPKSDCLSGTTQTSFAETISGLRRSRQSKEETRPESNLSRKSLSNDENAKLGSREERHQPQCEVSALTVGKRGSRVLAAVAAFNEKSKELPKEPTTELTPQKLDPQAIECAFESLLVSLEFPSLILRMSANFRAGCPQCPSKHQRQNEISRYEHQS